MTQLKNVVTPSVDTIVGSYQTKDKKVILAVKIYIDVTDMILNGTAFGITVNVQCENDIGTEFRFNIKDKTSCVIESCRDNKKCSYKCIGEVITFYSVKKQFDEGVGKDRGTVVPKVKGSQKIWVTRKELGGFV